MGNSGDVFHADTFNWSVKVRETALSYLSRYLSTEAPEEYVLMRDHDPSGFLHTLRNVLHIQWNDGADIDNLNGVAF